MAFNERLAVILSAVGGDKVVKTFNDIGGSAKKAAGDAQNSLSRGVNNALSRLGVSAQVSGAQVGAGIAAGAAVGGAALIDMVKHGVDAFIDLTSQARAVQRVTGTTAEEASTLAAVVRHLGIDVDTASVAFGRAEKNIGTNEAALNKWGITVARDAQGNTDFYQTLLNVVGAYNSHTDQATRAALASQLFGRGYQALLPLLGKSREEIAALADEAAKHHEVFSQDDLDKGREFQLTIRAFHEELGGLSAELGSTVVPSLTNMTAGILAIIEKVDSFGEHVASMWDKVPGPIKQTLRVVTDVTVPFKGAADAVNTLGKHSGDAARQQAELAQESADLAAQIDAETAAAQKAVQEVDKLAAAPLKQADALDHLRDAQTKLDAARAENPAEDLRRGEEDLRGAQLSRQQAVNSLADAEEHLADVQRQAKDNALELRRAELNLRESAQSLRDSQKAAADAQAELNRLRSSSASTPVQLSDAEQKLADAQLGVDEAQQRQAESQDSLDKLRDPAKNHDVRDAELEVEQAKLAVAKADDGIADAQKKVDGLRRVDKAHDVEVAENDLKQAVLDVATAAGDSAQDQIAALESLKKAYPELIPFIDSVIAKLKELGDVVNGVFGPIPADSWWWKAHPNDPGNPNVQAGASGGALVGAGVAAAAGGLGVDTGSSQQRFAQGYQQHNTFNVTVHAIDAPTMIRQTRELASRRALLTG